MNQLDSVALLVINRDEPEPDLALSPIAHCGDFAIAGQDSNRAVDPDLFIRQLD